MKKILLTLLFLPMMGLGQSLTIGDTYQGGIIFWLNGNNSGGLIAAPVDQSTSASWGCVGQWTTGASNWSIGGGAQNTIDMVNSCPSSPAANICLNLTLGGWSDWYLPSID